MSRLGVCSWSLEPSSPDDLASKINACGLKSVQLALDPIRMGAWGKGETVRALEARGISILSGMWAFETEDYSTLESIRKTGGIVPDATWPSNLAAAREIAQLASELHLSLVTFHAGFLPEAATLAATSTMHDRLRQLADVFGDCGVRLGLETGQEHAPVLMALLSHLDGTGIGVNFDPANLILYGMGNPVPALALLRRHVLQVHIKDALPTTVEGTWGSEVPVGTGQVDWDGFFALIDGLDIDCVIEREAGTQRVADIRVAAEVVRARRKDVR